MKLLDQDEESLGDDEPGPCTSFCESLKDIRNAGKRQELKESVRRNKLRVAGGCCAVVFLVTLIIVLSQLCYSAIREDLNKKNGILSPHLRRKVILPRPNF